MVQWVQNLTAVARVAAVPWIQSLAWKLSYAVGVAIKKNLFFSQHSEDMVSLPSCS